MDVASYPVGRFSLTRWAPATRGFGSFVTTQDHGVLEFLPALSRS